MRRTISGVLDRGTEGQMQHRSFLSIPGNFCECAIKSQRTDCQFQQTFRRTAGWGEYCEKNEILVLSQVLPKSGVIIWPFIANHSGTHSNLGYHEVLSGASKAYISPINQARCPRKHIQSVSTFGHSHSVMSRWSKYMHPEQQSYRLRGC